MVLPQRVRTVFRVVFVISLLLLLVPLILEHLFGLYLFLPETVQMVLMLVDEAIVVISLLLSFRLSEYRWMRVTVACLLGVLVAISVIITVTTQPNVVTIVDDSGPETLVIEQNSWELGTDNRLFLQENALFLRSLDCNLITATSATPFANGDYTLEWSEDSLTIQYKEGSSANSVWSTAVVALP